jgi:hypothetical protein
MVLGWNGVTGETDSTIEVVERWRRTAGLSFADAWLAALAHRRGCAVCTKTIRELEGQGGTVPQPLPSS